MRRAAGRVAACIALSAAALGECGAQEFSVLGGGMRGGSPRDTTFAWMISYQEPLGEHFAASLSYLNEGHIPDHHRDGQSAQLWAMTRAFDRRLTLAAGLGPYRYFDTTVAESGVNHADEHGTGVLYSLSAVWRSADGWRYELRFNHAETKHSIDSSQVLLGVGALLERDGRAVYDSAAQRGELTLFAGVTIVNSFDSESAPAASVEYRHAFGPLLKASVALMREGDAQLLRRDGLIAQGWLEPSFSGERFTLGVGVGGYFAVDRYREDENGAFASGIITLSASLRFGRGWAGRFSWHRIHSDYDRDADVLLLGIGHRI